MKFLSLDDLFIIAEETPFLEKLQSAIPQDRQAELSKLMQDAGVQIDREMNSGDPEVPVIAGEETARLNAEYKPVTSERVTHVLQQAYLDIETSRMVADRKQDMLGQTCRIMEKLKISIPGTQHPQPIKKSLPPHNRF